MNTKLFYSLYFLLISISCFSQNNELLKNVYGQLEKYNTLYPQEKIYVETDKPYYSIGETIWFKAYLLNGINHLPNAASTGVHIELINSDNKIIARRNVQIINGGGAGDFELDESVQAGNYLIRGYSNFMRNFSEDYFFYKEINILDATEEKLSTTITASTDSPKITPTAIASSDEEIDLGFFPEGGDMIVGMSSKIAIKSVNHFGNSIEVEGKIFDNEGLEITSFKTFGKGLGLVVLKPELGKEYTAKGIYNNQIFEIKLPGAISTGYLLQLRNKGQKGIDVTIKTNLEKGLTGLTVIGQMRGEVFCVIKGQEGKTAMRTNVPIDSLADGIAQFTLFGSDGLPYCERLVFIENNNNQTKLEVFTNKTNYTLREKIKLDLSLKDHQGNPLISNLHISVTDQDKVYNNLNTNTLKTQILLDSDLPGLIENPNFFFDIKNSSRKKLLDLLMMTQGWRRFSWKKLLADQFPTLNHLPEIGFNISGTTFKYSNRKKAIKSNVFLTVLSNSFQMDQLTTEHNGHFVFPSLNFTDSTEIMIQARGYSDKHKDNNNDKANPLSKKDHKKKARKGLKGSQEISIHLDKFSSPKVNFIPKVKTKSEDINNNILAYLEQSQQVQTIDESYDTRIIGLDEVIIRGKKNKAKTDPFYRPYITYKNSSHRLVPDSMAAPGSLEGLTFFNFIRGRIPGIEVRGSFPNNEVIIRGMSTIRGSNSALLLLNGMETSALILNGIRPSQIAFIDVLNAFEASIYGGRGSNGVIAVYTKTGFEPVKQEERKGVNNFIHPGYYKAREFYKPNYETKKPIHIKPDYRTTLHWEPIIKTDEAGKASISFYSSDQNGNYRILVEGITMNGIPIRKEIELKVGN